GVASPTRLTRLLYSVASNDFEREKAHASYESNDSCCNEPIRSILESDTDSEATENDVQQAPELLEERHWALNGACGHDEAPVFGLARPRLGRRSWMTFSCWNLQAGVRTPHWTNGMSGYM